MDRYKKRSIGFANVEDKRDLRFIRKSVDRANLKHKRLSELRRIDLGNLTLDEEEEKLPEKEQVLVKRVPKKDAYAEKLKKWKEEKELKKKLEAKKKIPIFKVHRVTCQPLLPSTNSTVSSKNKEAPRFIPKPPQVSKVVSKPITTKDYKSIAAKAIQKPLPSVNAVPKSVPTLKENSRFMPTGKINPRPVTTCIPAQKPTMTSKKPTIKSPKPTSAKVTVSDRLKPPSNSCSAQKVLKPPLRNCSVSKQIPKTQPVSSTGVTTGIPRSGITSRILPPRSCNKQISTLKNSVANGSMKYPQQKKIPASQAKEKSFRGGNDSNRTLAESNLKCTGDTISDFEEHIAPVASVHEEEPIVEKLKATKSSFAPDDFVFEAPESVKTFEYPSGGIGITAMFAKVFGMPLSRRKPVKEPCPQTEDRGQSESSGHDSKVVELKSEAVVTKLDVDEADSGGASSNPEGAENIPEYAATESCRQNLLAAEEKDEVAKGEPSVSLAKPTGPEIIKSEASQSVTLTTAQVIASSERDLPRTRTGRKSKVKDVPLCGQLQAISENSELLNDSELESRLLGFDAENFCVSDEKTPQVRRSRRLASVYCKPSPLLDSKYFQKSNCEFESVGDSDDTFAHIESTPVSVLASGLSELHVDSPSVMKQRHSKVPKTQPQSRISLLGTPEAPQTRSRKSVKGDLISFSPIF